MRQNPRFGGAGLGGEGSRESKSWDLVWHGWGLVGKAFLLKHRAWLR